MSIDMKALKAKSAALLKKEAAPNVQAIVVGTRGSRKSGASIFTWGKLNVFAILAASEEHGLGAQKYHPESNVTAVTYDRCLETGDILPPKEALNQFVALVQMAIADKDIDVIVADGLTALDKTLQNLPEVKNDTNGWNAIAKVEKHYLTILDLVQQVKDSGKHCVFTLASRGFSTGGVNYEVPEMFGKSGVSKFAGEFGDILFVKLDENGDAIFDFSAVGKKVSTKADKKTTETVEMKPRVKGLDITQADSAPANFEKLLAAKGNK